MLVAGLAGMLVCLGCAGPRSEAATTVHGGIPFPVDRRTSATDTTLLGTDFEDRSMGSTFQGNAMILDAQFSPREFALYRFNVADSVPSSVDVALDPVGTYRAYIGVSDYNIDPLGRWKFAGPFADLQTLNLDAATNASPLGNVYIAVSVRPDNGTPVAVGTAKIDQLVLHENKRPIIDLLRWPASGQTPLTVNFDATATTDPDGPAPTDYRWDWESDGTQDDFTAVATNQHVYDTPGTYTMTLEVMDSEGASATISVDVTADP